MFFIFSLSRFSNHFCQRSYQKIFSFHNEYQKYAEPPTFSQRFERDLEICDNETTAFFKKNEKLRFMEADFDKCRKENNLNSLNLWNMARGTLILKDCDIASYPCSN